MAGLPPFVPAVNWGPDDQKELEVGLAQYSADAFSPVERYLRISLRLPGKSARDVALRVRWMADSAKLKKRKGGSAMVGADKAKPQLRAGGLQAVAPAPAGGLGLAGLPPCMLQPLASGGLPSVSMPPPAGMAMTIQPGTQPFAPSMQPVPLDDHGAQSVGGVGGPIASLLEANYALLNQFKVNMQACRVHENTDLLVRFRDNILSILNQMNTMQGVMSQMPPLPVRMNVELANNFLPKAGAPSFFSFSGVPPMSHSSGMPINMTHPGMPPPFMRPGVATTMPLSPVASPLDHSGPNGAAAMAMGQQQQRTDDASLHSDGVAGGVVMSGAGSPALVDVKLEEQLGEPLAPAQQGMHFALPSSCWQTAGGTANAATTAASKPAELSIPTTCTVSAVAQDSAAVANAAPAPPAIKIE